MVSSGWLKWDTCSRECEGLGMKIWVCPIDLQLCVYSNPACDNMTISIIASIMSKRSVRALSAVVAIVFAWLDGVVGTILSPHAVATQKVSLIWGWSTLPSWLACCWNGEMVLHLLSLQLLCSKRDSSWHYLAEIYLWILSLKWYW